MSLVFKKYLVAIKLILLLFVIYTLLRLGFYVFNADYFDGAGFNFLWFGLRFDAVAISITLLPFLVLYLLPFNFFYHKHYQQLLKVIFILINGLAILVNCIDFAYFKFSLKRSGADVFQIIAMGDDAKNNILSMAYDFWYVPMLSAVLILVVYYRYAKITAPLSKGDGIKGNAAWHLLLIPFIGLAVLGFRGGYQLKPLRIITASDFVQPLHAPLVLNTTFTIIKTFNKEGLEPLNYFHAADAQNIFNPLKNYGDSMFKPLNVVVIILESIGKEYMGCYNAIGYTPFLDSLMKQGLSFTYSFANAKRSVEGLPAVVASIPALMAEPFITSVYDGNTINSLASTLKQQGYGTAFFHGGNDGTMGFDNFASAAGYDMYYGRKAYGTSDFDGNWGVFDEPFYKFFIEKMNGMKPPFHTTFFSLSSHHPYTIPAQYKNKFIKGTLPIHEAVGYADYALSRFFNQASKQAWFANTVFVITADHTSIAANNYYKNSIGSLAVPILFYRPDNSLKKVSNTITQQADIMPSVLHYLHYSKPFISFGNSVFDSTITHFAASYNNSGYQFICNNDLVQFNGDKITAAYRFKTDSLMTYNMQPDSASLILLKAYIQQYHQAMIFNELTPKPMHHE